MDREANEVAAQADALIYLAATDQLTADNVITWFDIIRALSEIKRLPLAHDIEDGAPPPSWRPASGQ